MRKNFLMIFSLSLLTLIFIFSTQLEAAPVKLGFIRFESSAELLREAGLVNDAFIKTLSASDSIAIYNRQKTQIDKNDLNAVSDLGKSEGCQYMLVGSVKRDRDIVINVRMIDVNTAEIFFSMSIASQFPDDFSLQASSTRLADKVLEKLTGEYPKISSVKGKDIYINRGTSSGLRKGDLYRVYQEFRETVDKDGNSLGKNVVDLAIVEIKSLQKNSSVANLYKNGGDTRIIPRLNGNRIEKISKGEAKKLILQKTFSMKTIEQKTDEAKSDHGSFHINMNPNLTTIPEEDIKNVKWEAEHGYPKAQNKLGNYYMNCREYSLALKWFQSAAEYGNNDALNNLGYMYSHGLGVQQDYKKAFNFYLKAAEKGHAPAQNNIGFAYMHGEGVRESYLEAVAWFSKASEQGNHSGQANLGYMYEYGLGVKKDIEKAVELYTKSAEQNDIIAKLNLGLLYLNEAKAAKKNPDKQNYLNLSRTWYQKALEQAQRERNEEVIKQAQGHLDELANKKL